MVRSSKLHMALLERVTYTLALQNVLHVDGKSLVVEKHLGHVEHNALESGNGDAIHDCYFIGNKKGILPVRHK